MKTFRVLFTVLALSACLNVLNAQTYAGDNKTSLDNLQKTASLYSIVASQNVRPANVNNSIYVQQIGNNNTSYSRTTSNYSDISLSQLGNGNDIYLDVSANRISEEVLQVGNNHSFTDIDNFGRQTHAANVIQYGANQNLILLGGQNSISDKMIVSMQGRNQTIIVRNLNN